MLQIQMPDATHWIRVWCPLCGQQMCGVRLRPLPRTPNGASPGVQWPGERSQQFPTEYPYESLHEKAPVGSAICSQYCCPDCQFWFRVSLPREAAAGFRPNLSLV